MLLGACMLVSWTTNTADIAPALAKLGRPLKFFRLPVDDWAATTALALRSFPLLVDEFRVLFAARKLRPKSVQATGRRRRLGRDWVALAVVAAVCALALGLQLTVFAT